MAGIIKAGQSATSPNTTQATAYQFADVSDQANAYVAAAKAQANEILRAAKQQSETLRRQAEQQGQHAAAEKAEQLKRRELAKQVETLLPALQKAIESLDACRYEWLRHWEQLAIQLACAIAARVIRREVQTDPGIPLTLIQEALQLATGQGRACVHLHPEDLSSLNSETERLATAWNRVGTVEFTAASDVPRGSCRVTTEFGQIDQRFAQQLARIQEELAE